MAQTASLRTHPATNEVAGLGVSNRTISPLKFAADGEYRVFLADDAKAKVMMYRWKP